MFHRYAEIAFRLPLDKTYTYELLAEEGCIGQRVVVDFHGREEEGIITDIHSNPPDMKINPVRFILDPEPVVNSEQIQTAFFLSDYYLCGPGEALFKMFPKPGKFPGKRKNQESLKQSTVSSAEHELSNEQNSIFHSIKGKPGEQRIGPNVHLIHGITGSGKTEIYIHLMLSILAEGRSAIMLVPEIALTVQMIERLKKVFGSELALLHSGMKPSERFGNYLSLLRAEKKLVLGTRSAVFAPVQPALIIIDEEHDSSYRENSTPRYDARMVAIYRTLQSGTVVFGSASPSIEMRFHAERAKGYHYHRLEKRATGAMLPDVKMISKQNNDPLSGALLLELKKNHANQKQSLLLLNRRGYQPFQYCENCQRAVSCPSCSVSLNYHKNGSLLCHYCGYHKIDSGVCPDCGQPIVKLGTGTQRAEELLLSALPDVKLERLDADVARSREVLTDCITRFLAGEIDVLLGTQMIAKGLDAANVTLVGVLQADQGFYLPDYRAAERTFSLLMQVAGRAGRAKHPGSVFFETMDIENPVLKLAALQDYDSFFKQELKDRYIAGYPPFVHLIRLLFRSPDESLSERAVEKAAEILTSALDGCKETQLLGPAPAPIPRIQKKYRYHIIIKTKDRDCVREIIRNNLASIRPSGDTYLEIEFDPKDIL